MARTRGPPRFLRLTSFIVITFAFVDKIAYVPANFPPRLFKPATTSWVFVLRRSIPFRQKESINRAGINRSSKYRASRGMSIRFETRGGDTYTE